MGAKILIAAMLAILAGAVYVGYAGWTGGEDPDIPTSAYVALALGTIFSLVVGCGLMALVFYSSRKGFDEAADRHANRHRE
jgi:membrane protein DedA with SNARE-associated domain